MHIEFLLIPQNWYTFFAGICGEPAFYQMTTGLHGFAESLRIASVQIIIPASIKITCTLQLSHDRHYGHFAAFKAAGMWYMPDMRQNNIVEW